MNKKKQSHVPFINWKENELKKVDGVKGSGPPPDRPTPPLSDDWPPREQ